VCTLIHTVYTQTRHARTHTDILYIHKQKREREQSTREKKSHNTHTHTCLMPHSLSIIVPRPQPPRRALRIVCTRLDRALHLLQKLEIRRCARMCACVSGVRESACMCVFVYVCTCVGCGVRVRVGTCARATSTLHTRIPTSHTTSHTTHIPELEVRPERP